MDTLCWLLLWKLGTDYLYKDLGTTTSLEIQSVLHLEKKAGILTVPYNRFEFPMLWIPLLTWLSACASVAWPFWVAQWKLKLWDLAVDRLMLRLLAEPWVASPLCLTPESCACVFWQPPWRVGRHALMSFRGYHQQILQEKPPVSMVYVQEGNRWHLKWGIWGEFITRNIYKEEFRAWRHHCSWTKQKGRNKFRGLGEKGRVELANGAFPCQTFQRGWDLTPSVHTMQTWVHMDT